ncbi:MAG: TetR family transcriptional regulator, partial [Rhodococcus sp. (in: high G+C Gram-positive bacteria)]
MPKIVDHDERRLALADAVLALIAREGISAVTT